MTTDAIPGIPPVVESFAGIDRLGRECRIAETVEVMRFGPGKDRLSLADRVSLYSRVRLALGDCAARPETGIHIGSGTLVNVGAYLSGEGGLSIGEEVLIGPGAKLLSAGHEIGTREPVIARAGLTYGAISIGRGAWIGAGAIVLQGVKLGEGAVLAAGAVLTRDLPAGAVAAGVPARILKYRPGFRPAALWRLRRWPKAG